MVRKMNAKSKKLTSTLTLTLILFCFIHVNIEFAFSVESQGGKIDLFTQKEPYNGKGPNMPSDAFGLDEEVIVYVSVTFNEYPEWMIPVAFEIHGPENPLYNITFFAYAQTDDSGIANISFRIGLISEVNFGEWMVAASVYLAGEVVQDFLSFEVGWIVEIVSIKTVDENNVEQTKFMRGDSVGVELAVRNIAMTEKKATLTTTIYDLLNVPISSKEIADYKLPPNSTILYITCFLSIPEWASTGNATVSACAYTAPASLSGVPYCPEVSRHFLIVYHDIAVLSVETSPIVVYKGEPVNIDVIVKNEGREIESFNISVYYNETNLIDEAYVTSLQPNADLTSSFVWDTNNVTEGFYQITAYAEPIPGEIDISNNIYVDGVVEIRAKPLPVHDIAILNIMPSSNIVYIGEILDINVLVKNKANQVESFNVTVYYNSSAVGTLFVDGLAAGAKVTLVFHWNTQGVKQGNYILSAFAEPVPGEENVEDNYLEDGVVKIATAPTGWFVPEWFWWLLLLLLILILILLLVWYYRRRKRKEAMEPFISGWTAWYYGYDLQNES